MRRPKMPTATPEQVSVLLVCVGQAALVAGLAMIWIPLAAIVLGVELTAYGLLRSDDEK